MEEKRRILEQELQRYGKTHRNREYYTKKDDFQGWFASTLQELATLYPPLEFKSAFECYQGIVQYLERDRFCHKKEKTLLLLGGTGIVGKATAEVATKAGYNVTVTGIEENPQIPSGATFVNVNQINELKKKKWDVIFQVYTFGNNQEEIYESFGNCGHLFLLSTTLVYDRSKFTTQRIHSNNSLASVGTQGAYVDHKLSIERFWQEINDVNWTILRPYHILGANSYLGCLPPQNRNPRLVDEIKTGVIELCDGGRIALNVTSPKDIGEIVVRASGNPKTFHKSYNAVNPTEVIARDYFLKIAQVLGINLKIKNKSGEECWDSDWQLTTLPHLYDMSDLERDMGFVPLVPLDECIKDALNNHPNPNLEGKEIAVHKRMNQLPLPKRHAYFS